MSHRILHLGLHWIKDHAGGLERYQHGLAEAQHALCLGDGRSEASRCIHEWCNVEAWVQSKGTVSSSDANYEVYSYASPLEHRRKKRLKLRKFALDRLGKERVVLASHHASVAGAILNMFKGHPHVVHFHGPWHKESAIEGARRWRSYFQYREEKRVYNSAQQLVTLSQFFANELIRTFSVPAERVNVIPGAIDFTSAFCGLSRSEARERMGWAQSAQVAICVRRLVRRVGIDRLIEAIAEIKISDPQLLSDFKLMIGGRGPLEGELQAMVCSLGLEKQVHFLGFLPDTYLPVAYRAADFSIVPTQALEGFGLVTLESLAVGTPCLATPVGGLPEVLRPLDENLLFASASAQDMAIALRGVLRGEIALPGGTKCSNYVRQNYDWSVIAPKIFDIYRRAISDLD